MIILDGKSLDLDNFVKIARHKELVLISQKSQELLLQARIFVEKIVQGEVPVYGINTGFGKLSDVRIKSSETDQLQKNLLMSHACGVGPVLPQEVVRGMMALRINALIKGHSGIRLETLEKLMELLNADIIPVVFEKGSLGASGDLAPLSHMSLPLIGLGEVIYQNRRMPTLEAFKLAKIEPLSHLEAKEGLSLINGTQAMNSQGALVLYDALRLEKLASLSLSMSLEALEGIIDAFDLRVHEVRGQIGQIQVAKDILAHLKGSRNLTHQGQKRIQDAYSLRCAPQVHGAVLDTLNFIKTIVVREMNAVTDNPILFPVDGDAISAGNFHGEPLALAFDYLAIALSELANISERRIERLVNPALSNGLPAFLTHRSGLNSGFMIVQYSAASLVSENKVLSHPASVDSIPSSANQEDHVSMGSIAANKAKTVLSNVQKVIGMEFFAAAQAIDLRNGSDRLGKNTTKAYLSIRKQVPYINDDQVMYPHIHQMEDMIRLGRLYHDVFGEV
jgi:histidine ammonia-lyase